MLDSRIAEIDPVESLKKLIVDEGRLDAIMTPLHATLAKAIEIAKGGWISRLLTPLLNAIPLAIAVLMSGFLAHRAIKALLFYVLAPRVTRAVSVWWEFFTAVLCSAMAAVWAVKYSIGTCMRQHNAERRQRAPATIFQTCGAARRRPRPTGLSHANARTDDFHGDAAVLLTSFRGLVIGDRIFLTLAFGVDPAGLDIF